MNYNARGRGETILKRSHYYGGLVAIGVLFVLCVALLALWLGGSTPDNRVSDVLHQQAVAEYQSASSNALLLSRTGGSNTWQQLAQTRQHLYALTQLNQLASSLLDAQQQVAPQDAIDGALASLAECETLLLAGRAIDGPLTTLRAQLETIALALNV